MPNNETEARTAAKVGKTVEVIIGDKWQREADKEFEKIEAILEKINKKLGRLEKLIKQ